MATLKVNGTEIYYEELGSRKNAAVVLSTPAYLDSSFYARLADLLKDEFHVILYDHRGQGQSAALAKRPDIESTTQDAIKLIEHLKIQPCHWVGNGLGAHVGLYIAVRRPDMLKSALLMGALPEGESPHRVKELDHFADSLRHDGMKTGVQSFMYSYFGESFLTSDDVATEKMRERVTQHLLGLNAHEIESIKQVYHRPSVSPTELKSVAASVMVAVGSEDVPDHQASYRRMTELINHSYYEVVSDAGYLLAIERPDEVAELVRTLVHKTDLAFGASIAGKPKQGKVKHGSH